MNWRHGKEDGGYAMIMFALTLMLLLGASALAIDLSAIRLDRESDQRVADMAASAGALTAATTNGIKGCEVALDYVAANSPDIPSIDKSGCSAFGNTCSTSTQVKEFEQTAGRFSISVAYPITDDHVLMQPGEIGSVDRPVSDEDGTACERLGVRITSTTDTTFARLIGFASGDTTVHSVAIASRGGGAGTPINLLVLDRFGCQGFLVRGQGTVIVDAVVNPATGDLEAGVAAADSVGTNPVCTTTTGGVVSIEGNNAVFRADGPAGCSTQTGTHLDGTRTVGESCGYIQTPAAGTPGCAGGGANAPACTPGSGGGNKPSPVPTRGNPITRAPVDHKYNCKPDYSSIGPSLSWAANALTVANEQNIPGCTGTAQPFIDSWIASVGQMGVPSGYTRYGSPQSCSVGSLTFPSGNWFVDCDTFSITGTVTFGTVGSSTPTNVVFKGHVSITSNGSGLVINNSLATPGRAFFRGQGPTSSGSKGTLTKGGGADVVFNYTSVYMAKATRVALSGNGAGKLVWLAPDTGPLDDLALWSESSLIQDWAGNAALKMEGVFFTPLATGQYTGNGGLAQVNAQWIADKLWLGGNGTLVVRPQYGRAVQPPGIPGTKIVR